MEIRGGLKVYLKTPELEDADSIAEMANDKELARNLQAGFPYPYTRADALKFIDFATENLMKKIGYHLGIRLVGTDVLVGMVGLGEISVHNKRGVIGYWLGKNHRGSGYAKAAAQIMLNYAFNELKLNKVNATVYTYNERSLKLLEGIGFKREGLMRQNAFIFGKFVDEIHLGLTSGENKNKSKLEIRY